MDVVLKFSKLGLTEDRSLEAVKVMIQDIDADLGIGLGLQQIISQNIFVCCRSDFGQENRIIAVHIGLILSRQIAVHTVTQFMDQGIQLIQ